LGENYIYRLIIVNDGSSASLEEGAVYIKAEIAEAEWISYEVNRGKGYALREGVKASQGDIIMYTDYDFPYTYGSMVDMIDKLESTNTIAVVGKRDDSYYAHISPRRRRISQYLKKVNRVLFSLPTDDTQCGLKAFTKESKELFLSTKTDRYLIDVEFLKLLAKKNAKVEVQMVKLRDNVVLSKISNMRLVKEMINYMKIMFS
jgi:glycosyltransferase involved in cell wall biosynthesis